MDLGIAGKSAFVAGGSKGMGRSAAGFLAAEGCNVALVARGKEALDQAVAEVSAAGGTALAISADLCTRDGVESAVRQATEAFGSPDIVIGQSSDKTVGRFLDAADEDFAKVFHILTVSQIYLVRATVPAMQEKKWGRFIHIGSLVGKEPQFLHPHIFHNTVRPSTVAYLRTVAQEVAADQVTVNVVGPGWTITPTLVDSFADMGLDESQLRAWLGGEVVSGNWLGPANAPMMRGAEPDEIGALIAFLASKHAGYLTGEWIAVSGGKHYFSF
jgi:NAD(P)-dependent dehydrogenase (short-subunit alcohol dehydrogenase family)